MVTPGRTARPTPRWVRSLTRPPAVVAVPSAQVRDDSYQAFATALSSNVLTNLGATHPRHDDVRREHRRRSPRVRHDSGDRHDGPGERDRGVVVHPAGGPAALISNYPGASNILLDGAPGREGRRLQPLHDARRRLRNAAVGSVGSGLAHDARRRLRLGRGRGYYALDVTDPRAPPFAHHADLRQLGLSDLRRDGRSRDADGDRTALPVADHEPQPHG